jgi:hypothetical protein
MDSIDRCIASFTSALTPEPETNRSAVLEEMSHCYNSGTRLPA